MWMGGCDEPSRTTPVLGVGGDRHFCLARCERSGHRGAGASGPGYCSPSRVDEQVIGHIETTLRYCKRQEDVLGSRAVLPTALGQQSLVRDLLAECPTSLRPRLLSVYSDMSTSAGFYFFDLDDFDRAWYYFDQARAAAQDAGNTELSIYALCEMSHAACGQGKVHTAIDTAAAARSLISKIDDPLIQVCVADKTAQAYAIDGQHTACMAECERAQDGLLHAFPGECPPAIR